MRMSFPKIYPILDRSFLPNMDRAAFLHRLGKSLTDAGATLMEYRDKTSTDAEVLADAVILRKAMPAGQVKLILDDRVDVALAADFDGVHVDAGDLPVADSRILLGEQAIIGTSASSEPDLREALKVPADYVSFGPVFPTTTKQTAIRPMGLGGVRRFREIAGRNAILVAAAGITLRTAPEVLEAGANVVAVASAIFRATDPAAEFWRWTAELGALEGRP
jgi:thiamine-phosphate pyrophosphorylase